MITRRESARSMRRWLTRVGLASAMLLPACTDRTSTSPEQDEFREAKARVPQRSASSVAPAAAFWSAQKLIYTAELRIEVKDVDAAARMADSVVKQSGALVVDRRMSQNAQQRQEARLVLRVPSDHLASALLALRQIGEVKEDAETTQDVAKEYADLETRLAVKEQTLARLRALVDNRAARLSDVLAVERELARVVTELEQMKGERRDYDQQIALSTINLTLVDRASTRSAQLTAPLGAAMHSSLNVLGTSFAALIYVVIFLLPWLAAAGALWWLFTHWRTRAARMRGGADRPPIA